MTNIKKHKVLLLYVFSLCVLALAAVVFCEEIQSLKKTVYYALNPVPVVGETDHLITLYPMESRGDEWFAEVPVIYHAGGEIEGNTYTNSLEAVENTLAEGGCFIEMDLRYTSDGYLVCAHNWRDVYQEDFHPTLQEFLDSKIQGKFTPLTAEKLIDIMRENPQMYLVTDIKNNGNILPVISDLVEMAEKDPFVLDRFIIQLYTGREKTSIREIYPFTDEQFIFTTYEWGVFQLEVAQICNEENIFVITVPYGEMSDEDAVLLRDLGFTVYEHTVNRADYARQSLERGIAGFYTDTLSPEDLAG